MYSASCSPLAICFATYCIKVSYGRIGYAVRTSTSASFVATATASLPLISASCSAAATRTAVAESGSITPSLLYAPTPISSCPPGSAPTVSAVSVPTPCLATCSWYCPRYRNPCERSGRWVSFSSTQAWYACLSCLYASHWLLLSANSASLTMVTQLSTGHTASQTPQPQHASAFKS